MSYDPTKHDRRSIRLPTWDYRWPGAYFVTVCTHGRASIFGAVRDGRMHRNPFGRIVAEEWDRTGHRDNVVLDAFVVMPDHVHGVLHITADTDSTPRRVTARRDPTCSDRQFGQPKSGSLPTIVGAFKSAVTKRINRLRKMHGASVWQRNFTP